MNLGLVRLLTTLLVLFGLAGLALADEFQPIPPLRTPVTDLADLLPPEQEAALNQKLLAFEARKGSQIGVLIVPTTAPETIFDYSFRVADNWKLGRKGVDDGVLFVIATQDRKTHLQVGYGLEGAIPDAIAKRILQDIVKPQFRAGDFPGGINAGVDALIRVIDGEALPAPKGRSRRGGDNFPGEALVIGLIAAFVASALLGRVLGSLVGAGIGGGVAMLVFGLGLLTALGIGVLVLLAALVLLFGGIGGLPWIGGGGGGGFGGGGSWSGGGGGFGGGGASGDW